MENYNKEPLIAYIPKEFAEEAKKHYKGTNVVIKELEEYLEGEME
jgi:hypothetical protein